MRAMSLGLIKGIIDEVDSVVNITWIQPRVLDTGRIGLLVEQLGGWTDRYVGLVLSYLITQLQKSDLLLCNILISLSTKK